MGQLPPDDTKRTLTYSNPDDPNKPHLGVANGTYTILLSGKDTAGLYTLIDMYVPPGGGPPLHRHDFEESFTVLEGEVEATFRGEQTTVKTGCTINIPANAPHRFENKSDRPARLLCLCAPAGQEELFEQVGIPVPTRTSPPPILKPSDQEQIKEKLAALGPRYKTELLPSA